jgi:6-pyruvoyl-tetrahydropterin synthase
MRFRIKLAKENFKFSCSHFTILGPDRAERLHGHNYYVAFDFNLVKPWVREITESFDELVLLPQNSVHLKLEQKNGSVRARFGDKTYEFPLSDVKILPTVNITSEELARQIAETLLVRFRSKEAVVSGLSKLVRKLSVNVEETRGQSVSCEIDLLSGL